MPDAVDADPLHDPVARARWLDAALAQCDGDRVALLQAVQRAFGHQPAVLIADAAQRLGVSPAKLYGLATFYGRFSLAPRGRVVVRVCEGTACHVRGAGRLTDGLSDHLQVAPGGTTGDLSHTLETVACLGCCSLAPVVEVDGAIHGRLDRRAALRLVEAGKS